jgi:hypothetical protein
MMINVCVFFVLFESLTWDNAEFLQVCDVMKTAVCTGGKKYKVVLVDASTAVEICLNTVLLERNLALPDGTEQDFKNMNVICSEHADLSEESDVETEESQIIDLSDINVSQHPRTNAVVPSVEESSSDISGDDKYDVVYDDIMKYLMTVMGVST